MQQINVAQQRHLQQTQEEQSRTRQFIVQLVRELLNGLVQFSNQNNGHRINDRNREGINPDNKT
ncbi:MAG: hypothetical protein ACKPKO_06310, partial [Candidatus Fonsibacter sp.]